MSPLRRSLRCAFAAIFGWGVLSAVTGATPARQTASADGDTVLIPRGTFTMGTDDPRAVDEGPAHPVTLAAYRIDRHEVSNEDFRRFVESTGHVTAAERDGAPERRDGVSWRHPEGDRSGLSGRARHPVVYVSWEDAAACCAWRGGRLPTEAQWERAARGTDGRLWPWGDRYEAERANVWGREDGFAATAPVDAFPHGGSPDGVMGMAGNVLEWCVDWYAADYYASSAGSSDPAGPEAGRFKVLRGGSWINPGHVVRATNRFEVLPGDRGPYVGFRCVYEP